MASQCTLCYNKGPFFPFKCVSPELKSTKATEPPNAMKCVIRFSLNGVARLVNWELECNESQVKPINPR